MPIRLNIPLAGARPAHAFQHMDGLRALVLRWLESVDAALSTKLHELAAPKPYSISPLWSDTDLMSFDIGLLDDDLLPIIATGIGRCGTEVRLGQQRFQMVQPRVAAEASWDRLIAPQPASSSALDFSLLTPTAHHCASNSLRKSVVLPSPELYFGSWLRRWNEYAPVVMDESILDLVADRVAVGGCTGGTQAIKLDRSRVFIGFEGAVRFCVLKPREVRPEEMMKLWALGRLAEFAGTGVETMRGMGQTRLLNG